VLCSDSANPFVSLFVAQISACRRAAGRGVRAPQKAPRNVWSVDCGQGFGRRYGRLLADVAGLAMGEAARAGGVRPLTHLRADVREGVGGVGREGVSVDVRVGVGAALA
jgi:hypothetical protein